MAFDEIRFPDSIAQGSSSGPSFKTNIADSASGSEGRTSVWSKGRLTFDIAYGIHKAAELAQVIAFFRACAGKARGFRFKDYSDYTSASDGVSSPAYTDQLIGTGDGSTTTFQLSKTYTSGTTNHTRIINKPVADTAVVALDGVRCSMVHNLTESLPATFISRASIATYFDSTGTLQTAAIDAARYGYTWNSTTHVWESSGLITEPAANNYIIDNTFSSVVTGTYGSPGSISPSWTITIPDGMGISIVGNGTEDGIPYVDIRFLGAPSANGALHIKMNTNDITTVAGDTWTLSTYMRILTPSDFNSYGSTMAYLLIMGLDASRADLEYFFSDDISYTIFNACYQDTVNSTNYNTLAKHRYSVSAVMTDTAGLSYMCPHFMMGLSSSLYNDFVLRIGLPQIEKNVPLTVATSPIKTTGSIGTRAADVYTLVGGGSSVKCAVDYTTGIASFANAPTNAVLVTAGYEFDVPVRFKDDSLSISLQHIKSGSASIELTEVRT